MDFLNSFKCIIFCLAGTLYLFCTQPLLAQIHVPQKPDHQFVYRDNSKVEPTENEHKTKDPKNYKAKSQSPVGPLPLKIPHENYKNLHPQNFEWNPLNLQAFNCKNLPLIEPRKSLLFQTSIGFGWLFYSDLSANLFPLNTPPDDQYNFTTQSELKRPLKYNQVPLYEYFLGRHFTRWMSLGFSYQFQGGMTLESQNFHAKDLRGQFVSDLSMNSIQCKAMLDWPRPIYLKALFISPYLGVGGGVVWQSWTRTRLHMTLLPDQRFFLKFFYDLYFKPSYQASVAATGDLGFRFQNTTPYYPISFRLGCKFNYWGQVRNLGSLDKQGNFKRGFLQPLRIKALYQWTPYISAEWNFSPIWKSKKPYCLNGRPANTWAPFFCAVKQYSLPKNFWTSASVGLGSLKFGGVRGILRSVPNQPSFRPTLVFSPIDYNRSPLFEYLVGFRPITAFKMALSYQYQGGITASSTRKTTTPSSQPFTQVFSQYISNLTLNSLSLKNYLETPYGLIFKNLSFTLYAGANIGCSWQTWSNSIINWSLLPERSLNAPDQQTVTNLQKQKIIANISAGADMGLQLQSAYPHSPYSLNIGIKYNYWGQARNLIFIQNDSSIKFLNNYLTIKKVTQWAPYLGFQWNFLPSVKSYKKHEINQKSIYRFFPFWVKSQSLLQRTGPFVGLNIGLGLLSFDEIRGSFGLTDIILNDVARRTPFDFRGALSYTPSPLYEYILGYSLYRDLKIALSLQHQGPIQLQTGVVNQESTQTGGNALTLQVLFKSALSLDSVMLKGYFYFPWPMIMLGASIRPYLGGGAGISLQTWYQTQVLNQFYNGNIGVFSFNYQFRRTLCPNPAAMADAGLVFQSALPSTLFSFRLGCKFNYWGGARNIGAVSKQDTFKFGLFKPFSIKGIYQVAPYAGVEWNF